MERHFDIRDTSDVGDCRRQAAHMAAGLGFREIGVGEIAILTTELVENIVKHAGGIGEMVIRKISDESNGTGIEIECTDNGPGMDASLAVEDGYSTAGTLGLGLGAVARLADSWELGALSDQGGTRVVVRKWIRGDRADAAGAPRKKSMPVQMGARSRPCPGMKVNGDSHVIRFVSETRVLVAVFDGLGHGVDAAEASAVGVAYTESNAHMELPRLFENLHEEMRHTRGAVIGMASIDLGSGSLSFLGVGNIEAILFYREKRIALVSLGGIVGHHMRRLRPFTCDWGVGATLLMCSDGIRSGWRKKLDSGLLDAHPESIAEVILSGYARETDDATIVGIRQTRSAQ